MSRIPSFRKYGDFMDSHPKSYQTWMRSSPANFGNLCANHWELNDECQQHTTHRPMDKLKEPTKCWKVNSETLSTTIRTIGINCCHWQNTRTIIPKLAHIS